MIAKLVTVLVAFLALQSVSCEEYGLQDAAQVRGLIEEFEKIFNKLKDAVTNAINDAIEKISALLDDVIELSKGIIEKVTQKIKKVVSDIIDQINVLKKKAEELKIDITECLGENEEKIIAIPDKLVKETMACVQVQIDEAKGIINNVIEDVKGYMKDVDKLWEDFKNCPGGLAAIACITRRIAEASGLVLTLPGKILGHVLEATKLMITVKLDLAKCETGLIINATAEAVRLSLEITKCIEQKIAEGAQY